MSNDIDLSPEYIDNVCRAAPFADNDAGIPQMVALIRALSARLTEVEADRDVWMADSAAAWDKCEERRLLQEAAEVQLAQAVEALQWFSSPAFVQGLTPMDCIQRGIYKANATLAKIGERHE
jgi:hypothetical protein